MKSSLCSAHPVQPDAVEPPLERVERKGARGQGSKKCRRGQSARSNGPAPAGDSRASGFSLPGSGCLDPDRPLRDVSTAQDCSCWAPAARSAGSAKPGRDRSFCKQCGCILGSLEGSACSEPEYRSSPGLPSTRFTGSARCGRGSWGGKRAVLVPKLNDVPKRPGSCSRC